MPARMPGWRRGLAGLLRLGIALFASPVFAQAPDSASIFIPRFSDPERRVERPEPGRPLTIRFLTTDDYPPFNYLGPDGALQGFNIDLARLICTELAATCTIQARRWNLLLEALNAKAGDAVIASHRIDLELRRNFEVSSVVYKVPARFVAPRAANLGAADRATLTGKSVATIAGSAHEAYLNAFFGSIRILRFPSLERALEAMRRGEADLAFGDGLSIGFWLNGSESLDCCVFVDGPFSESRFFGEGAGIVLRKQDEELRMAIDFALARLNRDGRFGKLYLRHFPIPFF